jgi:hypothetical protein
MALAVFPTTFDYELVRDTYAMASRYADAETTEMEDGPERQMPRASATWTTIPIGIILTAEAYDVLDSFIVNTLVKGTARFQFPIGRFDQKNPPLKMVYIVGGKFEAKPHAVGYVMVTMTLKVLNW